MKPIKGEVDKKLKTQQKVSSDLLKHIEELKASQEQEEMTEAFMADPQAMAKMEANKKCKERELQEQKEAQQKLEEDRTIAKELGQTKKDIENTLEVQKKIMNIFKKRISSEVNQSYRLNANQISDGLLQKVSEKRLFLIGDINIVIKILSFSRIAPDVLKNFILRVDNTTGDYVMKIILVILAIKHFSKNYELVEISNFVNYMLGEHDYVGGAIKDIINDSEKKTYNLSGFPSVNVGIVSELIDKVYNKKGTVRLFYSVTEAEDRDED